MELQDKDDVLSLVFWFVSPPNFSYSLRDEHQNSISQNVFHTDSKLLACSELVLSGLVVASWLASSIDMLG